MSVRLYEEAAMNDQTGSHRGRRRASAQAAAAAVAVLITACGGSAPSSASAPTYAQEIALAQCMRRHGVPDFPDPRASGGISVLERRQEIGPRRALGATKAQIRIQFLAEAIVLALAGGAAGDIAGAAATAIYAHAKGWTVVIPPGAWAGGLGAALLARALAGLLPAIRAARMSPTQALL